MAEFETKHESRYLPCVFNFEYQISRQIITFLAKLACPEKVKVKFCDRQTLRQIFGAVYDGRVGVFTFS